MWPLITFPLKSLSRCWEAVKAAGDFHKQPEYGCKEAFIFPIYVLLLNSDFQKPFFFPRKTQTIRLMFLLKRVKDEG